MHDGRCRVVIEHLYPEVDGGRFPIKRVVGEEVVVSADILADGHDVVSAVVCWQRLGTPTWEETAMEHRGNDRWEGSFTVRETGTYRYTVEGWVDRFLTWQHEFRRRHQAGQDLEVHLIDGAGLVDDASRRASKAEGAALKEFHKAMIESTTLDRKVAAALDPSLSAVMLRYSDRRLASRYSKTLQVTVERDRALFSTWYERFPRSCSPSPDRHGTLKDMIRLLPEIARMGFDVLYLPPIHPIGEINRKGKNNTPKSEPGDGGSPCAIGSTLGGHTAVHHDLGTLEDYADLCNAAKERGIELALDLALQCAPDHPYVKEHPEW
ncbi:MAG: DUF3416 domain-containing protein, partial [Proteobacteria bacterium]|nr:DUF3416 domain-containing protein [Pseudomonadota bacterium]